MNDVWKSHGEKICSDHSFANQNFHSKADLRTTSEAAKGKLIQCLRSCKSSYKFSSMLFWVAIPSKFTLPLNRNHPKRKVAFQPAFSVGYVRLQECKWWSFIQICVGTTETMCFFIIHCKFLVYVVQVLRHMFLTFICEVYMMVLIVWWRAKSPLDISKHTMNYSGLVITSWVSFWDSLETISPTWKPQQPGCSHKQWWNKRVFFHNLESSN